MGKLDGHCLCGAISYKSEAEPIITGICHCADCRRSTGTAFSVIVGVGLEDVEVTGTPKVYETMGEDRGAPAFRNFCGECGSPVFSILGDADDVMWIKAGTLDDASWIEPELEAWTESALPFALTAEREDRGYFPRGLPTTD